jgi:hypothetical protein
MQFNARAPMIVVSIPHVKAITPLDALGFAEAFMADFFTNAIRAGIAPGAAFLLQCGIHIRT